MTINPYAADAYSSDPAQADSVETLEKAGSDLLAVIETRKAWLTRTLWCCVLSFTASMAMNVDLFFLWRRVHQLRDAEQEKVADLTVALQGVQEERHQLQFALDVVRRKLLDGKALVDPDEWKQFGGVLVTPLEPRPLEAADQKPTLLPAPPDFLPPDLK